MLNRNNLEIAKLISADPKNQYGGMLVEPERTLVTDGKFVVLVETPSTPDDDFPKADGYAPQTAFEPFVLTKKSALDILKVLPTPYQVSQAPVTGYVAIASGSKKTASLYTTDGQNHSVFQCKTAAIEFPDWRSALPDCGDAAAKVTLNVDCLVKLLAEFKAIGVKNIDFRLGNSGEHVRMDGTIESGQHVTAVMSQTEGVEIGCPEYRKAA